MNFRRTGGLSVPRPHRSHLALKLAGALALSLLGAGLACVDPQGDYDDFNGRTTGIRGVRPDTGPVTEFETGDVDVNAGEAKYFVSCLPAMFASNPQTSILLYSEAKLSGGKLDFVHYPMQDTATTFSKSLTFTDVPHSAMGVEVRPDNTFTAALPGIINIPGKSQRITDNDLRLQNVVFEGRILSTERWCAELNGAVVTPATPLDAPGDFCIFIKMNEGDKLPTFMEGGKEYVGFARGDYHCP